PPHRHNRAAHFPPLPPSPAPHQRAPSCGSVPELTDRVRRAQDGDETAFRELYDEHAGRIYALCLRLTGDAATAQERTQDAFVRAWERLRSFRGDSAFGTWLHRLAVNVVLMERRGRGRRERRGKPASGGAAVGGGSGGRPAPGGPLGRGGALAGRRAG